MLEQIDDGVWWADSGASGPTVAMAWGTHGDERAPIEAGQALVAAFEQGELALVAGRALLIHSNPEASSQDSRWSKGGVDLNRCFHASVLRREPELYEEKRAHLLAGHLEERRPEALVDFHCTVEPGSRFLMQHPAIDDAAHRRVWRLLGAEVLLTDPSLHFGAVSLDEWMATRGRVGICYETGWIGDPANTPERTLAEMKNLLAGHGLLDGIEAEVHEEKQLLELTDALLCKKDGFRWHDGVGQNLQALTSGTVLGVYADETQEVLGADVTLIFPKKRPELVQPGKPLVYLASRRGG